MKQQESLAIKYNITETNLEIRREFIRLGEKDRKILISLIPWARKVAPVLAKEFYDWQFSFHPTRQFFEKIAAEQSTSLSALRQVLENAQTEYYVGIFTGAESNWGASYFEGRMRIGMIHDKINLPQKWYMGSYAEYQYLTRKHLRKSFRLSFRKVARAEEAIFKVFNYDQQAVCDSFLFNTFDSVGLSVDDIKTTGSADRTEHVDQIKLAADTLLKQAEAISAERMDDEVLKTKVAGTLGTAVKTMAGNLRKSKDEIDAAMAKVETNLKVAQGVVDEVNRVAEVLKEGKLSERADPGDADGAFKKLVEGFNTAIDNILEPVNEAVAVLKEMSKGDLTLCVTGDYKGDHSIMKEAMNSTLAALNNTLGQVATTVHQVSTGAQEVSNASQSLSQGATSQASSLQETTASMTEIGSQTKQNADNATQANQLATSAAHSAEHGDKQMKLMLTAMSDINEASDDISKIIKVIDEIAFQTNLLALNAAVEAARAGVHGKGFAVVAEEVRNLAQRSAKAAKETTQLIEGSVKKVGNGTEIANNTANALGEIVVGITKATDFVGEIASASNEQAMGIEEINQALCQIDNVTQANTAAAEESAAAAEELSSQAAHLQQILSKFKLKNQNVGSSNLGHATANVTVVDATPEQTQQGERGNRSNNTKKSTVAKPEEIISFDDDDFGKF